MAEPEGEGRLHVYYYGRENVALASQLLMMNPGNYRLSMQIHGVAPTIRSLAWNVRCIPSGEQIATISLASARRGGLVGDFGVPTNCSLQRLELVGVALDMVEQADISLSELRIERRQGN